MFTPKYNRASVLTSVAILIVVSLSFPRTMLAQTTPVGVQLNGEDVVGGAEGGWIATTSNVYLENDQDPDHTFSSGHSFHRNVKKIIKKVGRNGVLILLDDGSLHSIQELYWYPSVDYPHGHYTFIDNRLSDHPPSDSSDWKKFIGDAIYALGTPWSSSSPLVYVSRDTVNTWQLDTAGISGAKIQDIDLDTAQYVYAATDHGLFKENPDSNIWHKVSSFSQITNLSSVFVDRENRILVAGSGNGLYLSTDNGTSWNTDASGISSAQVLRMADDAYHNLFVTTGSPYYGPNDIYKSAGGTGPWQVCDSSIVRIVSSASFQNMAVTTISGDSLLVAGTSFGVFLSTDQGATWTMHNTGIRAEKITGIAKTSFGRILLSTALGIFSNSPPDTSWNQIYPTDGFESSLPLYHDTLGNIYTTDPQLPLSPSNGAAAVIKSTDGGTSWSPDTGGLSVVNGGRLFYVDEAGGQHSAGYQFPTSTMVLWSKALNGSWTVDTTGFPTQGSFPISMISDRNGYLYVSGTISTDRVMRRPLGAGAWVVDTAGIPQSVSYFGNMAAGKNGDMYGVVGYYGPGVMRRSAGTWSNFALPPSLASQYVTGICVDKSGAVFVAFVDNNNAPLGVYFTSDGGTSWTNAGLDSVYVTALVSYGDSTYALSSNAGAFFVGKNPSATNGVQKVNSPASFALFQNYPNPFNPTTTIEYSIGKLSIVDLKIFDLLGREVRTLVHGEMSAGMHEVSFDASKLASGVYFYRIEAGTFTETKKLVLLK